jgi:hypothetical protein
MKDSHSFAQNANEWGTRLDCKSELVCKWLSCWLSRATIFVPVYSFGSIAMRCRMNIACLRILPVLLMIGSCLPCKGQSLLAVRAVHRRWKGNMPEVLRSVAEQYQVPIIAELEQPLPPVLDIAEGTNSVSDVLNQIISHAPNYEFEVWKGSVIHFYSKGIQNAPGNFLSFTLEQFTMPSNVSELKLLLPARLNAVGYGVQGSGVVISGFKNPELTNSTLPRTELKHVSGREILLMAAQDTRTFFSIIVFPNRKVAKGLSENYAFQHWFWGSLNEKEKNFPLYVQPPPQPAAQQN